MALTESRQEPSRRRTRRGQLVIKLRAMAAKDRPARERLLSVQTHPLPKQILIPAHSSRRIPCREPLCMHGPSAEMYTCCGEDQLSLQHRRLLHGPRWEKTNLGRRPTPFALGGLSWPKSNGTSIPGLRVPSSRGPHRSLSRVLNTVSEHATATRRKQERHALSAEALTIWRRSFRHILTAGGGKIVFRGLHRVTSPMNCLGGQ